jgi:hypothetical protein
VHEVLGRHVAGDASLHVGVAIPCLRVETFGAEVGDVGHPVVVEEDVVRFDVVVDDGRVRVLMQVIVRCGLFVCVCPRATPTTTSCRCGLFVIVRLCPPAPPS